MINQRAIGPVVALLSLLSASPAAARTWSVTSDGTGDAPTVQAAIDSSAHGDVVLVGPGRYFENINLGGKAIHLRSLVGPEATILDGSEGDSSVVVCDSDEDNRTIIEGFTITHGKGRVGGATGRRGAGVLCLPAAPTVRGNIIRNNRAVTNGGNNQSWGGGLLSYSPTGTLILEGNLFEDNFATTNGGGAMVEGSCVVRGNTFLRNATEEGDGGGLHIARTPRSIFEHNVFMENEAGDHGGGIYVSNLGNGSVSPTEIEIRENILLFNQSRETIAYDCSGGGIRVSGGAYIHHNTIAFNRAESKYPPAAGGICLASTRVGTVVANNIIYRNQESGIVAFKYSGPTTFAEIRDNIIFGNGGDEVVNRSAPDFILELIGNLFVDPMFCIRGPGSRGELAAVSPALHQDYGIIGAVAEPGCGPEIQTNVQPTTWGAIKARYGPLSSEGSGEERQE